MRFLGGFATASLLWGLAAILYFYDLGDGWGPSTEEALAQPLAPAAPVAAADPKAKRSRRGKRKPGEPMETRRRPDGTLETIGDNIGWDDQQQIDMAAGEEQLSGAAIEAGFDSAMPGIRRCLVLVPSDAEITGKLVFGMRVGSSGSPTAVNLTGPSAVTGGESGACLRRAAQGIRFTPFQGPDMVFKFPITLQ
jgi:hypothetical protein